MSDECSTCKEIELRKLLQQAVKDGIELRKNREIEKLNNKLREKDLVKEREKEITREAEKLFKENVDQFPVLITNAVASNQPLKFMVGCDEWSKDERSKHNQFADLMTEYLKLYEINSEFISESRTEIINYDTGNEYEYRVQFIKIDVSDLEKLLLK